MPKILVAEDDKFLSSAYQLKLSKEGFEVVLATTGEEAIKQLEAQKFDLLILDLIMPKKDGFETLEELRKSTKAYSKIPVIVASNLGQPEDIEKSKKLGANDYVIKSDLSMTDLIKKIKTYLKI